LKKILLGTVLVASAMFAKVSTIVPYAGYINYDNNQQKSIKDSAKFGGLYVSKGDLSYLLEFSYTYLDIKYKDSSISDLKQHDVFLAYSKYYPKFMIKGGIHYINNNDNIDLGGGETAIFAIGGYNWFGYNKLSYGLETYYSYYSDGKDENNLQKNVGVAQITPYISYSKAININTRNIISLKVNYIYAKDYMKKNYTSFEVSDTLYYKKFYASVKYYDGEMRSGVKDGGMNVYNTLDLMKNGGGVKLGYYIKPRLTMDVSYDINNFKEHNLVTDGGNSVAVLSLSYSY